MKTTPVNMTNCQNTVIHACKNITEKNDIVENVSPAKSHCVETVKKLDYNCSSQLTRWCTCNASALGGSQVLFPAPVRVFYV